MPSKPHSSNSDPVRPLFRWVWATVFFMFVAFLTSLAILPWRLIGLPFAVVGIVLGCITSWKAFRTPGSGILKLGAPLATISCGLFTIILAGQAFFLGPSLEYQECMDGALTLRSQQACKTTLQNYIIPTPARRTP